MAALNSDHPPAVGSAQRSFLAFWPDAAIRSQLRAAADALEQSRVGGRRIPDRNYHITVAFFAALPLAQVDTLIDLARKIEFERINLVFNRVGFWPRTGIVWLGCRETPDTLAEFGARLRRRLGQIGLAPERRRLTPHVTLFRKATRRPRLKITPLHWILEELCVVRSVLDPAGARYEILR